MKCTQCGREYEKIATHWSMSSCSYPKLTEYQADIVSGVLMGDGCIDACRNNCRLVVAMANKDYLEFLHEELKPHTSSMWKEYGSEEAAERMRENGFRPNANKKDYKPVWRFITKQTPEFNEYRSWYNGSEKQFPKDINLNHTTLKHWFVCDGTLDISNSCPLASISLNNERGNKEKICSLFDKTPINDYVWAEYDTDVEIRFNKQGTKTFFDYIGDPISGFEYKWPDKNRNL